MNHNDDDDDDDWFEVLAGRARPQAAPETVQEAQLMREAILSMHARTAPPGGEPAGLARLSARLAAEGLLGPAAAASSSRRPWLALAAMLVVSTGLLLLVGPLLPETARDYGEQLRGASPAQQVLVDDPGRAAAALTTQLTELGVVATKTGLGNATRVEAFVPSHLEPQVNALLRPYQVQVGNNGHLLLSFQAER
ncbi:hypothetical protein [Massilia glaciei]|uniref:hypothetical protein n=1 Tax=Massilia glaciei TaxID=1524097 RepID=UPI0015E820A6|nr:hypothetical protein [Massilia glaciei]